VDYPPVEVPPTTAHTQGEMAGEATQDSVILQARLTVFGPLLLTTTDKTRLKPLVESAIENEKKMLSLGIRRTRERLAEFERRFGISSAEFEHRLNALELAETVEFTDWRMEIGMLRLLESQYWALQEAQLD